MNEDTQPPNTIEDKLISIRLEGIFTQLHLILDVCVTCRKALDVQNIEQDDSIANVLRRCGSDKLHVQLEELTKIVEEFGGTTRYSDGGQQR